MGMAQHVYVSFMASNANSLGFIVQGHIILSEMLHCSVIRHHMAMQNNAGVPSLVAEKYLFHVHTYRSAMFVRFMLVSVY